MSRKIVNEPDDARAPVESNKLLPSAKHELRLWFHNFN